MIDAQAIRDIRRAAKKRFAYRCDADDILAAGYLGAVEAVGKFDTAYGTNTRPFLVQRAIWKMRDYARNNNDQYITRGEREQRPGFRRVAVSDGYGRISSPAPTPEDAVVFNEYLTNFSERERQVVLGLMVGLRLKEIGSGIGVSDTRVCQIVRGIRKIIETEERA